MTTQTYYPNWIANVVMVPKPNGTWRMCVDYTDLNKACPKDSFTLDQLVNSTLGHALLSFMDAYSSFQQIRCGWKIKTKPHSLLRKASMGG